MIVEERDYRLKPGKLGLFVSTYEKHGLPLQLKHLGKFLGYFTTAIGELNHVVALWGYEGLDDRARRRAAMLADPQWQEYLGMVADYLDVQNTRILTPSSFSPIQ
jgi:hypothetical protein